MPVVDIIKVSKQVYHFAAQALLLLKEALPNGREITVERLRSFDDRDCRSFSSLTSDQERSTDRISCNKDVPNNETVKQ